MRARDVPASMPKFVITKLLANEVCIDIKEFEYNC